MLYRLQIFFFALAILVNIPRVHAQTTAAISNLSTWTQTAFRSTAPAQPRHVNRVVTGASGRVFAAWYSQDNRAYVSYTDDGGTFWTHTALDRMLQIHQMIRLQDGTLVVGGESFGSYPVLWYSQDNGLTWKAGASGLPNAHAGMVWDLAERAGEVIITTSSETNVLTDNHPVVYAWNPASDNLRTLASLPGIGTLAVAVAADGAIFVSTQESAEHDDPTTAGQGRVYRSNDGGVSWSQTGTLETANRIYALTVLHDGSIIAGSGLNGGFYRTTDGTNWIRTTTLPAGQKPLGDPPVMTDIAVSRVYKILELASGALLVGTGNNTGDILITCDRGDSWISTASTGANNVVWGLAQESDGTVWIGNGSVQGDVWKAKNPPGISAAQHFSCASTPTCTLTASPATITTGGSSTLTASCNPAATSYVWTGGTGGTCASTSATCTVKPTVTTTYSVHGTNASGTNQAVSTTVTVTGSTTSYTVPGTLGDDVFALTTGNNYYGSAGNDTYIISPSILSGAVTARIIDTEGDNTVQLVDGMTITASLFYADAVQLTLSNGAKVQILGASKFKYQVGANLLAGDTASVLNYTAFATSLGASLSGTLPTAGTVGHVVPTAFTQATAPVPTAAGTATTVPGSLADDVLVPAGANNYLGGGGSDTYIISPYALGGALTARIIDTEGANVIQLVKGLTVATSNFYSDAVQLILSNGAAVQILGASGFGYQLGANAAAGEAATSLSYAQFAAALGVSVPTGTGVVSGSPDFVVSSP